MNVIKLGDVCELFSDGDWLESKDQAHEGIRIVQTGNVGNGIFKNKVTKARYISQKTFVRLRCTEIFSGDMLISRLPEPVGRACIIPETDEKMVTAVDCTIIRVRKDLINVNFLAYFMQSNDYFQQIEKLCGGATRKRISRKNLSTIQIPIPSLEQQRRVVKRLDAAFEKIDRAIDLTLKNTANSSALYSNTVENIFIQMMGKNVHISDLIKLEYGKPLDKNERKTDGKYSVYGANGVKDKSDKFFYDKPSIIVGRKGSAGEVTKVCEPFWPLDVTYYVTHDETETLIDFLFYVLKSLNLPSLAKGVKPGINRNDVYALPFKLPRIDEQRVMVKEIQSLQKLDNNLRNAHSRRIFMLKSLKQSMLHQAFSGDGVQ